MPILAKQIIEAAIDGLEAKKQHIDVQIAELRLMAAGSPSPGRRGGRRQFSPETIQRMRLAQQRRWAKVKRASGTVPKSKPKRHLSAAGRKAIIEATKRRWALKRAESAGGTKSAAQKPVRKKTAAKR